MKETEGLRQQLAAIRQKEAEALREVKVQEAAVLTAEKDAAAAKEQADKVSTASQ